MENIIYYIIGLFMIVILMNLVFALTRLIADLLIFIIGLLMFCALVYAIHHGEVGSFGKLLLYSSLQGLVAGLLCIPILPFSSHFRELVKEMDNKDNIKTKETKPSISNLSKLYVEIKKLIQDKYLSKADHLNQILSLIEKLKIAKKNDNKIECNSILNEMKQEWLYLTEVEKNDLDNKFIGLRKYMEGTIININLEKRHGCLTLLLGFIILTNSLSLFSLIFCWPHLRQSITNNNSLIYSFILIAFIINIVCAIALLKWKKWGFWGFTVISSISFVINISSKTNFVYSLLGLFGILILYATLQIGGEKKAWNQLQ